MRWLFSGQVMRLFVYCQPADLPPERRSAVRLGVVRWIRSSVCNARNALSRWAMATAPLTTDGHTPIERSGAIRGSAASAQRCQVAPNVGRLKWGQLKFSLGWG